MRWEPIDWRNGRNEVRDFFGVFGTYDYSPKPSAVFKTREEAEAWAREAVDKGELHSDAYCVGVCRDGDDGRLWVWNSYDDVPEGIAGEEATK